MTRQLQLAVADVASRELGDTVMRWAGERLRWLQSEVHLARKHLSGGRKHLDRVVLTGESVRAADLLLGAHLLGESSMRLTAGWWRKALVPRPLVHDEKSPRSDSRKALLAAAAAYYTPARVRELREQIASGSLPTLFTADLPEDVWTELAMVLEATYTGWDRSLDRRTGGTGPTTFLGPEWHPFTRKPRGGGWLHVYFVFLQPGEERALANGDDGMGRRWTPWTEGAKRWIIGERARLFDAHLRAIRSRLEETTGYSEFHANEELLDAAKPADDAWTRALYQLARAARLAGAT